MALKNNTNSEEILKEKVVQSQETEENTAAVNEKPEKLIYVGASVPELKQNTVFIGEIPEILNVPFVKELCIRVSEYGRFIRNVKDKNSREAFCYGKSAELAESLKSN